jgi:succinate dehydrogenase/fumarate reductase flavoprotein subunit
VSGGRGLAAVSLLVVAAGGCAGWPLARGHDVLERADRLAREGAWEDAAGAYGEYLARFPEAAAAPRAAASRDTLTALLAARAELARLREEIARLRDDLTRRDSDLVRVRQEADKLRADLERLKQIDLKLERRR